MENNKELDLFGDESDDGFLDLGSNTDDGFEMFAPMNGSMNNSPGLATMDMGAFDLNF